MTSDDMDWISDLPSDDWSPPAGLGQPTQSVTSNVAIRILSWPGASHPVLVELGSFIAEHSRFSLWFLRNVKGAGGDLRAVFRLVDISESAERHVVDAWLRVDAARKLDDSDSQGEHVRAGRDALIVELRRQTDELVRVRESWKA